jgi:hypothetical protein
MAKIVKPKKEFLESKTKPNFLAIKKIKDDDKDSYRVSFKKKNNKKK